MATTGITQINDYATLATGVSAAAAIQAVIDLIPNNDTTSSTGAVAGGGFLDEMSPAATDQLRVELTALKAAVGTYIHP